MKKIHRFITEYKITDKLVTIKDVELIHQWHSVLRFKTGEQIILANKNNETLCTLKSLNKKEAVLNVIKNPQHPPAGGGGKNNNEPTRKVTLYIAILKNENFELVVQKASEIGVAEIVPMITENTVKTGLKYERLNKIAREASELSGRNIVPTIHPAISFIEAIKLSTNNLKSKDSHTNIIFDISGKDFVKVRPLQSDMAIFIGPEGGWSEKEIALARENKFTISSLGHLTLRAETAGIVASYLATNL